MLTLSLWHIVIVVVLAVILFGGVGRIWPRGPGGNAPG